MKRTHSPNQGLGLPDSPPCRRGITTLMSTPGRSGSRSCPVSTQIDFLLISKPSLDGHPHGLIFMEDLGVFGVGHPPAHDQPVNSAARLLSNPTLRRISAAVGMRLASLRYCERNLKGSVATNLSDTSPA